MRPWLVIITVLAILGSVWSQSRMRNRLLRKLLASQQGGDEKDFNRLLETLAAQLYFSKLTRLIMRTNFALSFDDINGVKKSVKALIAQPKKNREFAICLMRAYTFELEHSEIDEALQLEKSIQPLTNHFPEVKTELSTLHRLYIKHEPILVDELNQKLDNATTPEAQMVLLYRLSTLEDFLGRKHDAQQHLVRLQRLASSNIQAIN